MKLTEREAIQAMEIMLRPGEGQCSDPTIAHKVLINFMEHLGIPVDEGQGDADA